MSRKTNRLKSRVELLTNERDHAKFMVKHTFKDNDVLQDEVKELRAKLNKIAEFRSTTDSAEDVVVYTMRISMMEIKLAKNPHGLIDHVFEAMRYAFHGIVRKKRVS